MALKVSRYGSFDAFNQMFKEYEDKRSTDYLSVRSLIILFVASNDSSQESWCSDCRKSQPVIDKVVEEFKFNDLLEFAIVEVGQRDEWKSKDNPFRTHKLQVTAVPTLISIKSVSITS